MKPLLKIAAVMCYAVGAASIDAGLNSRGHSNFTGASTQVSPRSLYLRNCARCHGADGKAQTAMGMKLEAPDLTRGDIQAFSQAKLIRVIGYGRPNMPAFRKRLTAKQISMIAKYVRTF